MIRTNILYSTFLFLCFNTLHLNLGKLLEAKRPQFYSTSYAANCIDLMLEDIGEIPAFEECHEKCMFMNGYLQPCPSCEHDEEIYQAKESAQTGYNKVCYFLHNHDSVSQTTEAFKGYGQFC